MAEKVTKILFDTKQAQNSMGDLAESAEDSAKRQTKAFNTIDNALDGLEGGLSKLDPRLGGIVKQARAFVNKVGPLGSALSAAGVAAVGLAANLVDVPQLLASSAKQVGVFVEQTNKLLDLKSGIDSIGDAFKRNKFKETFDLLNLQQGQSVAAQADLGRLKREANEEIAITKDKLSKIEKFLTDSVARRRAIESQLSPEKQSQVLRESVGGAIGSRAVTNLTGDARDAAEGGDLEKARLLVTEAKKRATELGNHQSLTREIERAEDAIVESLNKQSAKEKSLQKTLVNRLKIEKERLEVQNQRTKAIVLEGEKLREVQTNVRDRRRVTVDDSRNQARAETIGGSADTLNSALANIEKALTTRQGGVESFSEIAKGLTSAFFKGGAKFQKDFQDASKLEDRVNAAFEKISSRTATGAQEGGAELTQIIKDIRALASRTKTNDGRVAGRNQIFDQVELVTNEFLTKVIPAFQRAASVGLQPNQAISADGASTTQSIQARIDAQNKASGIIRTNIEAGATSAAKIRDALFEAEKIRGGSAVPSNVRRASSQGKQTSNTAVPTAAGPNITVNANVKGGIVDREVVEKITDIVNREIRKTTLESAGR